MQRLRILASDPYDLLAALFVTSLIVSNIVSVKIIQVGAIVFDAGTVLFPIAYIIGDMVTEIYGFKRMRRLLLLSVAMLVVAMSVIAFVGLLPSAGDWMLQGEYQSILGVVGRIMIASVVAITVGELLNAYVLEKLKARTKGKHLWMRLIASSAAGNAVDTVLFTVIAFAGILSSSTLLGIIATVFCIKMAVELIVSPLTMRMIRFVQRSKSTV